MSDKTRTPEEHKEFVTDVIAGLKALGIIAYGTRVAVVRDPERDKIGSIFVPDTAKRKEPRGHVVLRGMGLDLLENSQIAGLKVGDHVMYTKYNPIDFFVTLPNGEEVRLELMDVSDLYLGWRL